MPKISISIMRDYLRRSISSMNKNKLHGLLAEIDFRNHLSHLGYSNNVSQGGWIFRCEGEGNFGHHTAVLFPKVVLPDEEYPSNDSLTPPGSGLHTICATFHQCGIRSFFCVPSPKKDDDAESIIWNFVQLGLPTEQRFNSFPFVIEGFNKRERNYNFLRYNTDISEVSEEAIPEEFLKEHLRVAFQSYYMSEVSDIDGIFWGQQYTYPIEIKEKTAAQDSRLGKYFGLDIGPFVKLAFYAAKRGNLHSIFVVREIDNTETRDLANWWFIKFERLAQYASWVSRGGGISMTGGTSTVVRIPKAEFEELNTSTLSNL